MLKHQLRSKLNTANEINKRLATENSNLKEALGKEKNSNGLEKIASILGLTISFKSSWFEILKAIEENLEVIKSDLERATKSADRTTDLQFTIDNMKKANEEGKEKLIKVIEPFGLGGLEHLSSDYILNFVGSKAHDFQRLEVLYWEQRNKKEQPEVKKLEERILHLEELLQDSQHETLEGERKIDALMAKLDFANELLLKIWTAK